MSVGPRGTVRESAPPEWDTPRTHSRAPGLPTMREVAYRDAAVQQLTAQRAVLGLICGVLLSYSIGCTIALLAS